jgi:hypothetical protein
MLQPNFVIFQHGGTGCAVAALSVSGLRRKGVLALERLAGVSRCKGRCHMTGITGLLARFGRSKKFRLY